MKKEVFINLAVIDLKKSVDFYTAIGFKNNPQFTDEISIMLLTHPKFCEFTKKNCRYQNNSIRN
ncbi:putative lactoylglutathione lyase [Pedobacter sp. UYEF25]